MGTRGSGRTSRAVEKAVSLAKSGKRVLLVAAGERDKQSLAQLCLADKDVAESTMHHSKDHPYLIVRASYVNDGYYYGYIQIINRRKIGSLETHPPSMREWKVVWDHYAAELWYGEVLHRIQELKWEREI